MPEEPNIQEEILNTDYQWMNRFAPNIRLELMTLSPVAKEALKRQIEPPNPENESNNKLLELAKKFKHLKNIFENLPIGIILKGSDVPFFEINSYAKKILGISNDELPTKTISLNTSLYEANTSSDTVASLEVLPNPIDGVKKKVVRRSSKITLDSNNQPNGTVDLIEELFTVPNDLEESIEKFIPFFEHFYQAIEHVPDPIIITNDNNIIIYVNKITTNVFNLTKNEIIGKTKKDLYAKCSKLFSDDKNTMEVTINGESQIFETTALKLTKYKMSLGEMEIFHNITEEKEKQKNLELFIGIIVHDIRAPLTAFAAKINSLKEKLKKQYKEEKGQIDNKDLDFYIENLFADLDDALRIFGSFVENLLNDLSAKKHKPEPELIYEEEFRGDLLEDIYLQYSTIAKTNGITFDKIIINKDFKCFCDLIHLKTVIRNIINNATKFCKEGDKIQIECSMKDDNTALIKINNTGPKIKTTGNNPNDIFDRTKNKSTKDSSGKISHGLGLPFCKELIVENRGEIYVKTSEAETTFFIELPIE